MISTPPYKSQKPCMDRGSRKAVFIIDSGASHHAVNDISILDDIIYKGPREDMGRVRGCVSNSGVSIKGYGNIPLIGKTPYASGIVSNVLSVSQLYKDGFVTSFRQGRCTAVRIRENVTEEIVGIIFNNKYVAEISVLGVQSGKPDVVCPDNRNFDATCYMLHVKGRQSHGTSIQRRQNPEGSC